MMTSDELQKRTKAFALRIIKLADALPRTSAGRSIGSQVLRSGTSVSANYRAARRSRSRKEFRARVGVVVEEADETEHWLELIMDSGLLPRRRVEALHAESVELMKIFASMWASTSGK